MTAGTSVIRTTKASTNTPAAKANAIVLIAPSPSGTKAAKTANMITAAATTTRAEAAKPFSMAARASPPCTKSSRHPGDQEHLVVHGQAEQHAHQQRSAGS